ncbi:MAG: VWA domain-containing protein [Clostridiales bacterium]|nr:VWA domain-containing protein [Clostridiales bacterium]
MRCIFKRYVSIVICIGMLAVSLPSLANADESTAAPSPTASSEENSVSGNEITGVELSDAEPEINSKTDNDNAALSGGSDAVEENAGNEAEAEEASQTHSDFEERRPSVNAEQPAVNNDSSVNAKQPAVDNDSVNNAEQLSVDNDSVNNAEQLSINNDDSVNNAEQPVADNDDERVLIGVNSSPQRNGDELTRVCEDAEVIITATYTEGAKIPDEAEFVVKKITGRESDMIKNALETTSGQALASDMVISDIVFYDISFVLEEEEIEPSEPVKMRFEYKRQPFSDFNANANGNVTILHLTNNADNSAAGTGEDEQFLVEDVLSVDKTMSADIKDSGKLFDRVEIIEPVISNFEKGINDIEFDASMFSIYAVALVSIETSGDLYKRVDSIDDINADYLIVAADRSYALKAAVNSTVFSAPVTLIQVKGRPDYYYLPDPDITPVTPDMLFNFTSTGSQINSTIKSLTGLYLNIPATSNFVDKPISFSADEAQEQSLVYTDGGSPNNQARQRNTWVIGAADNDLVSYGGNFKTDNLRSFEKSTVDNPLYLSQRAMLIYKQVSETLTVPGDYNGDGETDVEPDDPENKPSYPAYIEPSDEKSGSFTDSGTQINFDSDASTSQVESDLIFSGRFADDGKVWTDKSVVYGEDNYQAFSAYADGTFSVALSALAQKRIDENKSYDYPLDFVFIIDASGSMNESVGGKTRAELLNNALNLAIHAIMKSHPQNRVGIVDFATDAKDDLRLGRYYVGGENDTPNYNGAAYNYFYTTVNAGQSVMHPDVNLRDSNTKAVASAEDLVFNGATYTQLGIQKGAQMLIENDDITHLPFEGGVEKSRTPVIILMSDGAPTLATNHYMNPVKGPVYGQANNSVGMAPGVMGYYTILSANYFKGMVNSHYQDNALFYTIGIGISSRESGDKYQDLLSEDGGVGDEYGRAVLNPSPEYMQDLIERPSDTGNQYRDFFGKQMYALLNRLPLTNLVNDGSSSQFIKSGVNTLSGSYGVGSSYIPVIENPYDTYAYATSSYSDDEMTQSKLDEMMSKTVRRAPIRMLAIFDTLQQDTPVEFTDNIGEGMEILGVPVLRYNGENYQLEQISSNTAGGVATVNYKPHSRIVKDCEGGDVDLRDADITLITTADGKQSLKWSFTEKLLPAYRRSLWFDYYFEMLPIRLIYQVKPTDAAMRQAVSGAASILYAGDWKDGGASVSFSPSEVNTYYTEAGNLNKTIIKTNNITETIKDTYSSSGSASAVTVLLGNNGRLYTDNYMDRLPETGGSGTVPFVLAGLFVISCPILIYNRKNIYKKTFWREY